MADPPPVKKEEEAVKEEAQANPAIASDPDEDDLSDLDDVLDEFQATKLDSKPAPAQDASSTAPSTSGPGRPLQDPADLLMEDEDAFAQKLQEEMESLLGQKDFKKQFDDIMKEMGTAVNPLDPPSASNEAPAASSSATTSGNSAAKADASFQETIKKTMERMQESGDQASAAAATAGEEDILAQLLKEMETGNFGGEGNDEDYSKILMGMMEQLTNKEILYEPMKELNDKFPAWMDSNREKVDKDDLKRYEEQHSLVKEITARFERKGYSDSNAQDREYIVERMQKMQAAGSPPPDLVGDMSAAQEALSEMDQGCPTQ
ncbi:Pex19 protein family-domain-containing protein [Lophiotrema nucula]|uniref:Pex19 protein family-domain-containing protein n=1 Tax=Lophiotrema nucula TaxID=690887 RepID=A0A6A5ZGY6_9PLEO|nr:Pex19 protein family-domain-containing protein [Lophiotrema nucula]